MTRRVLTAAYLVALAVAIVLAVGRLDLVAIGQLRVSWVWVLVATAVALAHRSWGVVTWTAVLRLLGATDVGGWWARAHIWATAWLGRYLPGKVLWILGKVYFGRSLGIGADVLALGALVEVAQQVAMTLAVSAAILAGYGALGAVVATPTLAIALGVLGVLVAVLPTPYRIGLAAMRRWRGAADGTLVAPQLSLTAGAAAFQFVGLVLTGAAYVALTRAVAPDLAWSQVGFVFATFTFAGAIGMLAVFAPSGIGVREGVQMLLLTRIMPAETAAALAVLGRVWSTAIDVAFYAITKAADRPGR